MKQKVRAALSAELAHSIFCIEVVCDGHVVQAEDLWEDLNCPGELQIVVLPERYEFSEELLLAVREGKDTAVQDILQKGQSLQVPWHKENDNLLVYCCRFNCSEAVACTLIAAGSSATTDFEGHSVLRYCIRAGWVSAAKALLGRGVCLQTLDHSGKTCNSV